MKKSIYAGLIFGLLFVSMIGFASAQSNVAVEQLKTFVTEAIKVLKPILDIAVGDVGSGSGPMSADNIFFAKVVILVILFALIFDIISVTGLFRKPWVMWTISIVVPILGVRFLKPEMVAAIAVPSSAFAIAVVAGLPFILYFFFVQRLEGATVRRIAWILFAVVFLFVWAANAGDNPYTWIYALASLGALVMIIMDGTFKRLKARIKAERQMSETEHRHYLQLLNSREEFDEEFSAAVKTNDPNTIRRARDRLDRINQEIEAAIRRANA